jgi:hypothetical protein
VSECSREVLDHSNFNHHGGDGWTPSPLRASSSPTPATACKFRVRDLTSASAHGEKRGFEIELPQGAGTENYSTGDVWATIYRGSSVQTGADVGFDCTDKTLESVYAQGPLNTSIGSDIVAWVAIRHHGPRWRSEEANPYHREEFHVTPRGFEVLRTQQAGHEG